MAFWSDYRKSLKPLEVEEPIDVWVHRPLGYVVAKALLHTPVTPNAVTFGSILFGLVSGAAYLVTFPGHLQTAGGALFVSAVLDCADGQLARMRESFSRFGRMLDGTADLIVTSVAVAGAAFYLWHRHVADPPLSQAMLAVAVTITVVTGSFHTTMYDHYKNVFLRLTTPTHGEGEDYETALARYRARGRTDLLTTLVWPVYLFYVKSQGDYVQRFDPHTASRVSRLPEYTEERARIYRSYAGDTMKVWRRYFGFGSLVFGIALATALDVLEWYMVLRLVLLNVVFYGYLRPAQRRASEGAFRAMGADLAEIGARV